MISLQSDKPNEHAADSDESLQTFSKTCSIMYAKISRKQYEYLQAMTLIQDDFFDSCNGLIKEQVDMLEEYANRGILSKEYMMPIIGIANRLIESYLNYVSLEYDLVLSRMQYHHKMLKMVNDITPNLMKIYLESIKPFKSINDWVS
ncbi:MAG TPA: hypothetical protein VFI73_09820 [Candidatus Nitrosopolaris sp.]|nr:hypothetical protein [Candidatus Nitrosopolaris sp.]